MNFLESIKQKKVIVEEEIKLLEIEHSDIKKQYKDIFKKLDEIENKIKIKNAALRLFDIILNK